MNPCRDVENTEERGKKNWTQSLFLLAMIKTKVMSTSNIEGFLWYL
jgi:hypothetical protein